MASYPAITDSLVTPTHIVIVTKNMTVKFTEECFPRHRVVRQANSRAPGEKIYVLQKEK